MGCVCTRGIEKDPEIRMGVCTRDIEKDIGTLEGISYLLSLPNELLIEIVSFLETRDKVKLRYVSRRLRSICDNIPSLWRQFVWPKYTERRERRCLYIVMKAFGIHIRQLYFPSYFLQRYENVEESMSEMTEMLKYCSNLTHLGLKCFLLNSHACNKQLRETIRQMKFLEVLSISHCSNSSRRHLKLNLALKELNIFTDGCYREDIKAWIAESFKAQTVNIVSEGGHNSTDFLLNDWRRWSSKIPAGHVVCVKLYENYEVPLNLFQIAPKFQIQYGTRYGEMATFPLIGTDSIGLHNGYLELTDHDNGSRMVHKGNFHWYRWVGLGPIYLIENRHHVENIQLQLDVLANLTELNLSLFPNKSVKLIIVACPQLQQLHLGSSTVEDLQVIATYCSNLEGLSLRIGTETTKVYLKVWEILSSMKLTYLHINISLVGIMIQMNDVQKKQLVTLFKQCVTLQALELTSERFYDAKVDYGLLSHFPSLQSCSLDSMKNSTCVKDILATCKMLKCFCCNSSRRLSLSFKPHNNLQKLCISSECTDLDDNFMDTVSAHGGLTYVVFFVRSVNSQGITTLIKNSPNLFTFVVYAGYVHKRLYMLHDLLTRKFAHRQLVAFGLLELVELSVFHDASWREKYYNKYKRKCFYLWPPPL